MAMLKVSMFFFNVCFIIYVQVFCLLGEINMGFEIGKFWIVGDSVMIARIYSYFSQQEVVLLFSTFS